MDDVADGGRPLYRADRGRWAKRRAQYLQRRYDLRGRLARALAWSELGYSSSGIARRLETTESTVRGYLDEASERFGGAAVWARAESQLATDADLVEEANA